MKAIVGCEIATVYRGGGRRYFTKRAAYNGAARAKIKSRCDCEPIEYNDYQTGYMAMPCRYHEDMDRCAKLQARLARWYAHLDSSNDSITGGGTPYRGCTGSVSDGQDDWDADSDANQPRQEDIGQQPKKAPFTDASGSY